MVSSWIDERMLDHSRQAYFYEYLLFSVYLYFAIFFIQLIVARDVYSYIYIYIYIYILQYLKISFNPFHEVEIIRRLSKRMRN